MPFKNKDLGWIRFNFKREADSVLDDVRSRTPIAPVDWYEELDEETKEAYNKEVLNRTANTYSSIYNLSQEEENDYRKRFDIDYTAFIKSPIAEQELIKQIMDFVKELIGDYRWGEWLTKMNLNENEDLDQKKIKSWALFSDSILERIYQEIDDEHELDAKWNELSAQSISPDQQFAIDYFYNYRKMELGLDYNDKLIGKMELGQTVNELKEAAIGFKPDATSKTQSQVRLIMSNLEQAIEYLQNNAFVKSYDGEKLSTIKDESDKAMDALNSLMQTVHSTPDSKKGKVGFRETQEIRLKNYKPLGEEKTWADIFGDRAKELADKQKGFAANDPVLMKARAAAEKKKQKVEPRINPDYKALKNAPKIKALEKQRAQLMRDMEQEAEPEGGPIANRYGRALDKIDAKIAKLKESVNENIETLLSPEDLKYYRAHRDEIEDILNAEFRSSKLSAKDAVEKHKAMKEGTCGYNTDAKTGKKFKTPGGLEERIKTLVKEFTKQK